jgi:hypothetical protein
MAKAICAMEVTLLSKMACTSSLLSPAFAARSRNAAVEWMSEEASLGVAAIASKDVLSNIRRKSK